MTEQGTDLELEEDAVQTLLAAEEGAAETARRQLNAEELAELNELFRLIDSDGNGEIDKDEMVELLHSMSVRPSEAEINILFDELDWTKDGRITLDEFVTLMAEGAIHSVSREEVISAFRVFDSGTTKKPNRCRGSDLVTAFQTYIPDKVKSQEVAEDLLSFIRLDAAGSFDFVRYVDNNTPSEDTVLRFKEARKANATPAEAAAAVREHREKVAALQAEEARAAAAKARADAAAASAKAAAEASDQLGELKSAAGAGEGGAESPSTAAKGHHRKSSSSTNLGVISLNTPKTKASPPGTADSKDNSKPPLDRTMSGVRFEQWADEQIELDEVMSEPDPKLEPADSKAGSNLPSFASPTRASKSKQQTPLAESRPHYARLLNSSERKGTPSKGSRPSTRQKS